MRKALPPGLNFRYQLSGGSGEVIGQLCFSWHAINGEIQRIFNYYAAAGGLGFMLMLQHRN